MKKQKQKKPEEAQCVATFVHCAPLEFKRKTLNVVCSCFKKSNYSRAKYILLKLYDINAAYRVKTR